MTIQIRRDTAANWTSTNPTLAAGQPGFETDTGRIKIGDGSTAWTSLAYRFESGSVADGDKGDVTVSGSGATWTVDAGAITLSKMANLASSTIIGRVTGGSGAPEALTAAQVRTLLNVADGATANASNADLRDRTTHTGAQAIATVTGLQAALDGKATTAQGLLADSALQPGDTIPWTEVTGKPTFAAVATSGAYADLTGLPTLFSGAYGDLSGIPASFTPSSHTHPASDITDFNSAADARIAAASINALSDVTITAPSTGQVLKWSGSAWINDTDATGGGGGSGDVVGPASATDNAIATFDGTTGKLLQDSGVTAAGGAVTLASASPAPPAADHVTMFGRDVAGRMMPAFIGPSGLDSVLQPNLGRNSVVMWVSSGNGGADTAFGIVATATGTSSTENVATTNVYTYAKRRSWRVTTASTTAVVGWRAAASQFGLGGTAAGLGGFTFNMRWGPATGVTNASHRAFVGMRSPSNGAPTDVNPSTLTNLIGMGYDAADTNIQFIHNDASGTATKIDLGASFPKPSADLTKLYELTMFAQPGTTQSLGYAVRDLGTGDVATGTVTTDIPATTTLMNVWSYMSVGGVSSVIGMAISRLYIETDT